MNTNYKFNQERNKGKIELILLFCSAIICILFIINMKYGWFTWQTLDKAPDRIVKIIAIKGTSVWVKAASGEIYFNETSEKCQNDCWVVTTETPAQKSLQDGLLQRMDTNCSPAPPLIGVAESMAECRREAWTDYDSIYALRFDGSLVAWHFNSHGEGYILTECFHNVLLLTTIIFFGVIIGKRVRMVKLSKY